MSELKLISPMLDNFVMGEPMSDHHAVRCCPAMQNDSDERYIVKIISIPASQAQAAICRQSSEPMEPPPPVINTVLPL